MAGPTVLNKKKFSCWDCDAFQYDDPGSVRTGTCRKHALFNLGGRVNASEFGVTVDITSRHGPGVFPHVADGPLFWCLEWTKATHEVQTIPPYPPPP